MFNKLENRMEELREHFNKERENVIKNKSEMNTITEMKSTLKGIDRLVNTENRLKTYKTKWWKLPNENRTMKEEF